MEPTGFRVEGLGGAAADLEVVWEAATMGTGHRLDVSVRNPGPDPVALDRVVIAVDGRPSQVLEHGYQSWSPVRRCEPGDVRPVRAEQGLWVRGTWHADPASVGRVVQGDQFLVTTEGAIGWLDARVHLGTVSALPGGGLEAIALLDGIALGPGRVLRLDPLWLSDGPPGHRYSEFAGHWSAAAGARPAPPAPTPLGWCSWYQFFAEVTPADIRRNLALAVGRAGAGVVQIDDGWQADIGDWLAVRPSWREPGLDQLAAEISGTGARAGIWTAPFLAGEASALRAEHPEWMAVHESGRPLRAMYNPDSWGGWAYALDPTNPAVLDHLRTVYAGLTEQGFDYHKIDFCYAATLPARRHDPQQTRAQALRAGLQAVRDGIGDDAFLLGCGCPFGPAVGVVDAMRVSPDVAPHWAPRFAWPGFEESAVAAVNAVRASILRSPLHRRLFLNDPDCLLLRPTGTDLSANEREALTDVVANTGAFVILSDDLVRYTDAEWAVVEDLRRRQAALDHPLDLADPFDPDIVPAD